MSVYDIISKVKFWVTLAFLNTQPVKLKENDLKNYTFAVSKL